MKYFVEVMKDSITDEQAAAKRLADTLKLDITKALALLRRNPVTKPVSQAEAEKVARLFRKAGIEVFVRSENLDSLESPESIQPPVPDVKTPTWPDPKISSPDLPVKVSSPEWPEVQASSPALPNAKFSSPELPDVKISSSTWPDVKISSPNLPDVSLSHPDLSATPVQDEALKLDSGFFGNPPVNDTPAPTVPFESKYPTLPPVSEAPVVQSGNTHDSVGRFLLASFLPGLLGLAGITIALYLLGLPILRHQQAAALQNATSTLASSLSGIINAPLDDLNLRQQLQGAINRTQPALEENNVDFVLLTDTQGNQVAGWYQGLPTPGVPDNFINPVLPDITRTLTDSTSPNLPIQQQLIIDGQLVNVANQIVRQQDTPVGVVSVGMQEKTLIDQIRQPSIVSLVAGLIPLLLSGLLLSLMFGRKQS
jgi:hypothetical protein